MPSNSILEKKQAIVADLAEKLKSSPAGVVVNYQGITVEDDTAMRKALREAGVKYMVMKNSLTECLTHCCIILNGDTLIVNNNTCGRALELFNKIRNYSLLLLKN